MKLIGRSVEVFYGGKVTTGVIGAVGFQPNTPDEWPSFKLLIKMDDDNKLKMFDADQVTLT